MTTVRPTQLTLPFQPQLASPSTQSEPTAPYLQPGVIADRTAQGRIAELTADVLPNDVIARGAPAYFRTYEQVRDAMVALKEQYPQLVEIVDIGDSYEKTKGIADRDILALRLTNSALAGDKPKALHIGGIHAREIANPELLMTFAKQLVDGYGRDPEATHTLDNSEVLLVPMLNPDGHAFIERAYAGQKDGNMMKRKNASGPDRGGVDLNRNFDWHWGGPGASSNPKSDTYRGPSAASEVETQAMQKFIEAEKPRIFVDWHSYSKLNMYPWGDTRDQTKDHAGFKAMANKWSTFNHYSPIQAIELYPTTGTTDDYAYGKHNVPAMAVETGSSFHQSDAEFAQTLRENLPVLQYTSRAIAAPLTLVHGPDAVDVVIDPNAGAVSALIDDTGNGKDAIVGAELVLTPTAAPGTGIRLTATDGRFDSASEAVSGALKGSGLPLGPDGDGKLVYVRGIDAKGNWGPLTAQWATGPATRDAQRGVQLTLAV